MVFYLYESKSEVDRKAQYKRLIEISKPIVVKYKKQGLSIFIYTPKYDLKDFFNGSEDKISFICGSLIDLDKDSDYFYNDKITEDEYNKFIEAKDMIRQKLRDELKDKIDKDSVLVGQFDSDCEKTRFYFYYKL